jgi:hypothetical protein
MACETTNSHQGDLDRAEAEWSGAQDIADRCLQYTLGRDEPSMKSITQKVNSRRCTGVHRPVGRFGHLSKP